MSRRERDPLREMRAEERRELEHVSRSGGAPTAVVARAKALLAVADGAEYSRAAQRAWRHLRPGMAGRVESVYERRARADSGRGTPDTRSGAGWDSDVVARDLAGGVASGARLLASGQHLHDLVRPERSEAELAADAHLVSNGQCAPQAEAQDGDGSRPGYRSKKGLIPQAYREAEAGRAARICQDEAGPFQTVPYPRTTWESQHHPERQPHKYARNGTAKGLTLLRPATGEVRVKGVTTCPNAVLHA